MPELPDVTVYVERLGALCGGRVLRGVRVASPFLVRTVSPPLAEAVGRTLREVSRLGKRIVFELDAPDANAAAPLYLVLHLMIAGRLRYREAGAALPGRVALAAFDFEHATVLLTEAASKKRASLHVCATRADVLAFDRGGLEPSDAPLAAFTAALQRERHTLKRALTDPRLFSGIGNAYSDEILHRARLSPLRLTSSLTDAEVAALHTCTQETLRAWTERLRAEVGDGFPEKVTAFREGMAVHGRFKLPCPDCGAPIQRIAYAENETNYCARCQNADRLLADRSLSRLMKSDWPRTLLELEEGRAQGRLRVRGLANEIEAAPKPRGRTRR